MSVGLPGISPDKNILNLNLRHMRFIKETLAVFALSLEQADAYGNTYEDCLAIAS